MTEDKTTERLALFKKAFDDMIQLQPNVMSGTRFISSDNRFLGGHRDIEYSNDRIDDIIESGDPALMCTLSRDFFYKNGFYRQIIYHYAFLLTYAYVVIPQVKDRKFKKTQKNYENVLDYCENINIKRICEHIAVNVLVDGAYFGAITERQGKFALLDLPFDYCRVRFKGYSNLDIIELNLAYFSTISDKNLRDNALNAYPKGVKNAYLTYQDKGGPQWYILPEGIGIHSKLQESRPIFLGTLKAINNFEDYRDLEMDKELLETKKILVQQVPIDNQGELVFEPEEASELHRGAVNMLQNNKTLDVLTTYADVSVESLAETRQTINTNLNTFKELVFDETGVSSRIFNATGNIALDSSLKHDLSLMMVLADQLSSIFGYLINSYFANKAIDYSFTILPISYYNTKEYIADTFKLAQSGYSFILPALASGLTQKQFTNIKYLENEVLGLDELLKPLSSAYTHSKTDSRGRPPLDPEAKTDKTIKNQEGSQ